MEEQQAKSRPRHWPGEWMKDEKFWKDVASRAISAAITAGAIYVFGLVFGYFQSPQWTYYSPLVLITLPLLTGVIGSVIITVLLRRRTYAPYRRLTMRIALGCMILGAIASGALIAMIVRIH